MNRGGRLIWQAQAYLAFMALRYLALAAICFRLPNTPSVIGIPYPAMWGAWFAIVGVSAGAAAYAGFEVPFRLMLVVSFALTVMFSVALLVGYVNGELNFLVAPL